MYDCSGQCGWLRETRRIYGHVTKWHHWGMFIHWGSKLCILPNAVQVRMPPALNS